MKLTEGLNDMQKAAVLQTEGPLLILAGAGSGKTKVLTHRMAYLMEEKHVDPFRILAITFTNKAAKEMRTRVDNLSGASARYVWISTFHAMCVRMLRRNINALGYDNAFTIYDAEDAKTEIKGIIEYLNLPKETFKPRAVLGTISKAKNEMITAENYFPGDYYEENVKKVYTRYEKVMKQNNALDFDDLLLKTVELFKKAPEVLKMYQKRFQYIMVDEYQDTNSVQFELVRLLAGGYENLCVVGDDDQSIYKFRGANIKNILNFEKRFPGARVIRLEQNYRSTKNVLNAANAVIRHNTKRKEKTLWTENEAGEPLTLLRLDSAIEEAREVRRFIEDDKAEKRFDYKDVAILYRTNAQSRAFEEEFLMRNIPYRIIGGVNFYSRMEIKDILSYLRLMLNPRDDLSARRIINKPRRGIGAKTVSRIADYASSQGISFMEAVDEADKIPSLGRSASKVADFRILMQGLIKKSFTLRPSDIVRFVIKVTGYEESLVKEGTEEGAERLLNMQELVNKAVEFEKTAEEEETEISLANFLEEVSLVADIDKFDAEEDYVTLMTLHSSKGLEFPKVYLVGLEDGLFPGAPSCMSPLLDDMEEERRLMYVGLTRAKKALVLSSAKSRMIMGQIHQNPISRFVEEIPEDLIDDSAFQLDPFRDVRKTPEKTTVSDIFTSVPYKAPLERPVKNFGSAKGHPDYDTGDRVRHQKFGDGTVLGMIQGGRDYEVTVKFDTAGEKKMFAAFANMQKID